MKKLNESLHRIVENLNSQGIEARVYFNAEGEKLMLQKGPIKLS